MSVLLLIKGSLFRVPPTPRQLERSLKEFVHYYNNERYHESINNLVPADVYFGHAERKLKQRKMIKNKTLEDRKKQDQKLFIN